MRKVRIYGDNALRKKAEPIKNIGPLIHKLAEDMFETMEALDGIGLAAPQVGVSKAIIVIDVGPMTDEDIDPIVLINPSVVESSGQAAYLEGCLSIPGVFANVVRPETVVVKYQDLEGVWITEEFYGILARVAQHEIDHLHGVLFQDLLEDDERQMVMADLDVNAYDEVYDAL